MRILNDSMRSFEAWGSVDIVDKDGEVIPMEEFKKIMPLVMDRGGNIIDGHTNKTVGKILGYEFKEKEDGKDGVLLTGKIFKHYPYDDEIWQKIKTKKWHMMGGGLSFGGRAHKTLENKTWKELGTADILQNIEGFEFSIVDSPANPEATFTFVNPIAKQLRTEGMRRRDKIALEMFGKPYDELTDEQKKEVHEKAISTEKKVERRGGKWAVVHCHGSKAGKVIAYHDSKEQALRHHRAILANKEFIEGEEMKSEEILKPEDGRPPKDWFDRCVSHVREAGSARDPEAVCGNLWHNIMHKGGTFKAFTSWDKEDFTKHINTNLNLNNIDNMKKQEGEEEPKPEETSTKSLEERIAKIEKTLTDLVQKIAPVEGVKQEEEEEKKPPVPPKKKPEEEEKQKEIEGGGAVGGTLATDVAHPAEPEGVDVKIPKAVAEEPPAGEPGKPEEDKVDILEKKVNDIKKAFKTLGVTVTPRPTDEVKDVFKSGGGMQGVSRDLMKAHRAGKKITWGEINDKVAEIRKKEMGTRMGM